MKTKNLLAFVSILAFFVFLSISGLGLAQIPEVLASAPKNFPTQTDTVLDVCMNNEPETLYYYAEGRSQWQNQILSAVYDGPMDNRTYAYQPVIFEAVPTLDNGGAITATVTVTSGDLILNDGGNVVPLEMGVSYLPSGCYDATCAVNYTGGLVDMEQLVVTHTLLSGLTWSDGEPLTAEDMLYSFNLNLDPGTPANKYAAERTESYITTTLTQTVWTGLPGFFPFDYSVMYWVPMPEHVWSPYTPTELISATVSSRTPLGWGPYVIDEWVSGSHIAMHKNLNYFRAAEGLPYFDELVVHFGTELVGLLDGTCDVVINSTEDLAELLAFDDMGLIEVDLAPSVTWEHLDFGIQSSDVYTGFAAETGAFQDLRVRQAFAYCLDRQLIADAFYYGYGVVTNAYISDNHPYFPADATLYPYDPAEGRALLDAAGWVDTDDDGVRDQGGVEFSVTLKTTTAGVRVTTAGLIASQMAECGIQVNPEFLPASELFAGWPDGPVFGRKYDLSMFAWIVGWRPPCDLYAGWNIPTDNNPGGQNNSGYSNPDYDTACQHANGSLTPADRENWYGETVRIFTDELPVLPLFLRMNVGVTAPHITGFSLDPTDSTFWNVEELSSGVQEELPPEGGILSSPDDATEYSFPAGTFSETVTILHTPLSPVVLPEFGELQGAGHFFSLEASLGGEPVQPSQPYSMTIGYSDGELGIVMEDTLGLYYWDGQAWVLEPTAVVDPLTNTIQAMPDHFSYWAVLGESYQFRFIPFVNK
jgi:peptide/nickel transport system substrate-binding protein